MNKSILYIDYSYDNRLSHLNKLSSISILGNNYLANDCRVRVVNDITSRVKLRMKELEKEYYK